MTNEADLDDLFALLTAHTGYRLDIVYDFMTLALKLNKRFPLRVAVRTHHPMSCI